LTGLAKLKESERERKKETTNREGETNSESERESESESERARESERERASEREQERARASKRERERARDSERQRERARESERERARASESERERACARTPASSAEPAREHIETLATRSCGRQVLRANVPSICACADSPAYLSSCCSGAGKPHAVDDYYIWREWRRRIMLDSQMIKFRDPRLLTRLRSLAIFFHTMCLLITNAKETFIGMSEVST
jgi:hypothetical protein